MQIAITNIVMLNAGDSAILYGEIEILRRVYGQKFKAVVYDRDSDISCKHYPDITIRQSPFLYNARTSPPEHWLFGSRGRFRRMRAAAWGQRLHLPMATSLTSPADSLAVLEYGSADLIASTGGTYLIETYNLVPRILDYRFSLATGKPLVFMPQSMGPFRNKANREALRTIFDRSVLILRDSKSVGHVRDLGIKHQNVHVTADAAFALANPNLIRAAAERAKWCETPRVAVSVRDLRVFADPNTDLRVQSAVADLVVHLVRVCGAKVHFLSTCQGIAEYWQDDSKVAAAVIQRLPDDVRTSVTADPTFHGINALLRILSGFDLVVSMRMHMIILGLAVGVPGIGIAYEFKIQELFRMLGTPELVHEIETVTGKDLVGSAGAYISRSAEMNHRMFSAVEELRLRALSTADILAMVAKPKS